MTNTTLEAFRQLCRDQQAENRLLFQRCEHLAKLLEQERLLVGEYRRQLVHERAHPTPAPSPATVFAGMVGEDGTPITQGEIDAASET